MSEQTVSPVERVQAIDALRGFDMFFLTGGREIVLGLCALFANPLPAAVLYQANHPDWIGYSAWDLIMPLFLFITGAAMPYSLGKKTDGRPDYLAIYARLLRRVLLLWLFGMIVQGNLVSSVFNWNFEHLRLYSNTLQAIASGYLIASVALLHLPKWGQATLCALLFLGYWALMALVPVPGHGAGVYTPEGNLAIFVDHAVLGRFQDGTHYTWVLSSISFGGTVLLGVFAGHLLRAPISQQAKFGGLVVTGLACLAGGALWSLWFPIIKHIWSSSMALWAGGWSFLLLAFFYGIMDLGGYKRWAFFFIVIGSNALLAYMVGENFVGAMLELTEFESGDYYIFREAAAAALACALMWGGLYALYRRKWFLRV